MAVRKTAKGAALKRWFKEEWKDVRTGKACGRRKGEKRGTPYCRPSKRISSKTPKTSGEMTAAEKKKRLKKKDEADQATVSEQCPKCNHDRASFYTMQLRSADEGQTVFYTCLKCSHKWRVNN